MKLPKLVFLSLLTCLAFSTASTSHLELTPTHHLTMQTNHELGKSASTESIFYGFLLSPLLFMAACFSIWYNQKRAAIDSRRLNLAHEICQAVDVTSQASAIRQDNKLVHAFGQCRTNAVIDEQISGIFAPNLIKISRQVQVLEFRKYTRKSGNTQETYYELEWVTTHQGTQGERYNNPAHWFINKEVTYNTQVFLGGYIIDKTIADKCQKQIPFTPTIQHAHNIMRNTGSMDRQPWINGQYIYFTPNNPIGNFPQGYNNTGQPSTNEALGTLRVRYFLCPTGDISICARSTISSVATFSPFPIAHLEDLNYQESDRPECCCGCISDWIGQQLKPIQSIHLVQQGIYSRDQMFSKAIQDQESLTRKMRLVSQLLFVLSIFLFFQPITTILGYIPIVGGLVSGIVGFAIILAAVIVSVPLFLLVTSVAWIRFHPKVGAVLLIIGAGFLAFVLIYNKSKGEAATTSTAHFMSMRPMHI